MRISSAVIVASILSLASFAHGAETVSGVGSQSAKPQDGASQTSQFEYDKCALAMHKAGLLGLSSMAFAAPGGKVALTSTDPSVMAAVTRVVGSPVMSVTVLPEGKISYITEKGSCGMAPANADLSIKSVIEASVIQNEKAFSDKLLRAAPSSGYDSDRNPIAEALREDCGSIQSDGSKLSKAIDMVRAKDPRALKPAPKRK